LTLMLVALNKATLHLLRSESQAAGEPGNA
jgi:hypothetical protein